METVDGDIFGILLSLVGDFSAKDCHAIRRRKIAGIVRVVDATTKKLCGVRHLISFLATI